MPKSRRDLLKRRLAYSLGCLNRAQEHALELLRVFAEAAQIDLTDSEWMEKLMESNDLPSHARLCLVLQTGMMRCLQAEERFKRFATIAWGKCPDAIERWSNTGQQYRETRDFDKEHH